MKKKIVIRIARHVPTGAEVPMIVNDVDGDNIVTDFREFLHNRKGFTLPMLQNRWDLCRSDVLELLLKYEIPAHINHEEVRNLPKDSIPIDVAIFFEEYILGLEKKEKLSHSKLKSRKVKELQNH